MACYYCKTTERELRPYGPNGADVCFPCGTSPEHEGESERNFYALLEAASAASPVGAAVIGTSSGPQPAVLEDFR